MTTYDKIYINGQWVASEGTSTISVFDSITEQVMATIPEGTAGDVNKAAAAAKAAAAEAAANPAPEEVAVEEATEAPAAEEATETPAE